MKPIRVLNVVIFLMMVGLNFWAGSIGVDGRLVGSISDDIPALFTPAGYVFSIWGLIYLGLGGFVIYGLGRKQRDNALIDRIGSWFFLSSVFNILWLVAWMFQIFWLSEVFMALLLISLLAAYLRMNAKLPELPRKDFWLIAAPFSLYLGWVSVATVANTSALFVTEGITALGVSGAFWTVVMMLVAYVLSTLMVILRHDWIYAFVIIWASIGIGVKNQESLILGIAALIVALGLTLVMFFDRDEKPFWIGKRTRA
jgi:hypothetical protein